MASAIDEIINQTMNSVCKRSYIVVAFLYILTETIHVPQVLLVMFIAPPSSAFDYNPHARNAQSIITEWDLTGSRSWIPGMLQSIFFAGFMVGTIVFGQLSDKYGRKSISWKLFIGLIVTSAASAFTQNWQQLTACRIISGFLIGGLGVINTVWLQEMSAANMWVINGAVGSLSFTINLLLFVLIGYRFPSWRTFCIIMSLSGVPGFIFYWVIPESPRWLFSQQRYKEAESSIKKVARLNGTTTEYQKLQEEEGEVATPELATSKSDKNSILDLVKYPVLRYRVLILSVQWFTTSFVYYAITLGAASFSPNFYLALAMSTISQLPSVPIYLYFMKKKWCGRRKTLAGLMFLGGVGLFVMYIVPNTDENAWIRLSMSMVSKIGSSGCFTLIYVYTPELFPTVVRNVGLGSMSTIARFGSMAAPFMATYTVNSGSDVPFLGYGILSGIAGVLALILPETRGKRIINEIDEAHSQEDSDEN